MKIKLKREAALVIPCNFCLFGSKSLSREESGKESCTLSIATRQKILGVRSRISSSVVVPPPFRAVKTVAFEIRFVGRT